MKREIIVVFGLALALTGICCGCTVTNTAGDDKTASGSAVSGTAVKAKEVLEEDADYQYIDREDDEVLENSTNCYEDLYEYEYDTKKSDYKDGLIQFTKDHKKVKKIPLSVGEEEYPSYYYVDDEKLVYSVFSDEDEKERLYYVPLKKGKDGNDVVDFDKSKKIGTFNAELGRKGVFVNSDMVVLTDDDGKAVHYDFKTDKKTVEYPFGKELKYAVTSFTSSDAHEIYAVVLKSEEEDEELWCQDLDTFEWKKIGSGFDDLMMNSWSTSKGYVVFYDEKEDDCDVYDYYCYDLKQDKFSTVISGKDVYKKLKKEGVVGKDKDYLCEYSDVGCSQGRLYTIYETADFKEKVYQTQFVIVSAGLDGSGLEYEKALTETMWETGAYKKGKAEFYYDPDDEIFEDIVWRTNASRVMDIRNGKATFFYETKEKGKFAEYNLTTGEVKKISKKEAENLLGTDEVKYALKDYQSYGPDPEYAIELTGKFKYED